MNRNPGMPNLSQSQIEMLLKMASSKLGMKPEALKAQLQSGNLPQGVDSGSLSRMISDPKRVEELLNSKQAQQMLQGLMNGGRK